jgi:sporulation protein YlmC with PRC-barrel domain
MPHYGILHNYKFEDVQDVRGADVYGVNDEKLGTIDDIIFNHSTGEIRYVVVDAGGWLTSKKFLVPMNRIQPYGNHEDKFYAELDKERIQMLPEFHDEMLKSESQWKDYESRYQDRWNEGTVMYNKQTGRIVTPPMEDVEGARTQPLSEEQKRSLMHDFTPARMGKQDDLLGVASSSDDVTLRPQKASMGTREDVLMQEEAGRSKASSSQPELREPGVYRVDAVPEVEKRPDSTDRLNAHYGRRWIAFQQKLREGRDKVVSDCPLCGTQDRAA